MRRFELRRELWVPQPPEEVFPFFGDARNLERITPPWLNFQILPPIPAPLEAGALIDYKLRLRGVPIRWRTEIEVWEPPFRFVDRQLRGPYRLWRHEHLFEPKDGGTLCRDRVEYAVPGGALIERFFVRGELKRIFDFRANALASIFVVDEGVEWTRIKAASNAP